jgi:hypothetical protein
MSSPTTDVARAVWFLGLLAKRMDRQPDGTAVLALPARYVVALTAYHPEAGAAVYGQPCPICGGTNDTIPHIGDVIDAVQSPRGDVTGPYGRADAIADGELVDVTPMATKAGFRLPVALTMGAWMQAVAWFDDGTAPQAEDGRLRDVLSLAQRAIWRAGGVRRVRFSVPVIPPGERTAAMVTLTLAPGPGDDGEPVITIMLPEED